MSRESLSEPSFYILLSLSEPLHGYGIIKKVETLSSGRLKLGAGTLYGALDKMVKKKWISHHKPGNGSSRRKVYKLTLLGQQIFENEVSRLRELVKHGQQALKTIQETVDEQDLKSFQVEVRFLPRLARRAGEPLVKINVCPGLAFEGGDGFPLPV